MGRRRWVAVLAAAIAFTGLGAGRAFAAQDPEPAYVDLAISIGTLTLNGDYYGSTNWNLTTPGKLKPGGDVRVDVNVFNATAMSVNGEACSRFALTGKWTCTLRNSWLPTGWQLRQIRFTVQSEWAQFKPYKEKWKVAMQLQDGDLTNNNSQADVVRP